MKKKWYNEGLYFQCTACGKCCTGSPGYVFLILDERKKIAEDLNISLEDFQKKYCRLTKKGWSLLEKANYDCIFLKDQRCQIYKNRPLQCKTYPYWPSILESENSWIEEADRCKGIREEKEKVDYQMIIDQLKNYR